MKLLRKILNLVLFIVIFDDITCDYYTSISSLGELFAAEIQYVEALELHLIQLEKLNKQFQSLLDRVEFEHARHNNTAQYMEDPINAIKTIRRLVVDFPELEDLTQQILELNVYNESSKIPADEFTPPTDDDLDGAARGLVRLQRMYKLETSDIAKGYLKGTKYSLEMLAYHCFTLGQRLYDLEEYAYASEWLIEALHRVEDNEDYVYDDLDDELYEKDEMQIGDHDYDLMDIGFYPYVTDLEIIEHLAPSLYMSNNFEFAWSINEQLLAVDPENELALQNQILFERALKKARRMVTLNEPPAETKVQRLYGQVCSGELEQTPQERRHLRCRYVTNNVPFYLLGPMKMEELNTEPFVAHYHEVIHDHEIDQIIAEAEDTMATSTVGIVSKKRFDNVRISKNTWLRFKEHRFLENISRRLEDITGLSIESGEPLQVANYGIGGHYGPHHDFSDDSDETYGGTGNRLLTALFYINEIELGGGTAFPALRIMVPPIKGSLVVWYNLHKSLEVDYRTWHAGCPVLKGSKWICNEWFHTLGQEFKYPCGLQREAAISKSYQFWNWPAHMLKKMASQTYDETEF